MKEVLIERAQITALPTFTRRRTRQLALQNFGDRFPDALSRTNQ
jgi:hypothetical protein